MILVLSASACTTAITRSVRQFGADYTLEKDPAVFLSNVLSNQLRLMGTPSSEPLHTSALLYHLNRLLDALPKKSWHYRVSVVSLPMENAFAIGDGQIYFTEALLDSVASNEELVGILAHEIGHTELKHSYERLDPSVASDLSLGLLGFVRDQRQEFEADAFAIDLLTRADYSTDGLPEMLDRHERQARKSGARSGGLFLSHPPSAERSKRIRDQVAAMKRSTPVQPIPGEFDLSTIRKRVLTENREYGSMPRFEEDPERNPDLSASVRDALMAANLGLHGVWKTQDHIDRLTALLKTQLSAKHQAILHLWVGRLKIVAMDHAGAMESFAAAVRADSSIESGHWRLIVHDDDASAVKKKWKERGSSEACQKNLDCLAWAAIATRSIQIEPEERVRFARDYRQALLKLPSPAKAHLENLSVALEYEIDAGFYEDPEDRPKDYELPKTFTKTRQVKDLLELNRETIDQEWQREYYPRAVQFGFGAGNFAAVQSDHRALLADSAGLSLDYLFRWSRWYSGLRFNGSVGTAKTGLPAGSIDKAEVYALTIPFGRAWYWGRFRPGMGIEGGISGLSVRRVDESSKFLARGLTGRATLTMDFRIGSADGRNEWWVGAQAFAGHLNLGPTSVTAGSMTYWGLSLGLSIQNLVPGGTPDSVFKPMQPPVYY